MQSLKIFVGYDSREDIAWQVCRHSILRHSNKVTPIPLRLPNLRELQIYTRPADTATTEFSLSRFLTPYLSSQSGWSIFVDCDFLFTTDVAKLVESFDDRKAVYVVQHDYTPRYGVKMDGQAQTTYPRKNWSSFIAFNGAHPDVRGLTPDVVNSASAAFLHRFAWVTNDDDIGQLPVAWNFLVGEYDKPAEVPFAIHYTNGGPWFSEWQDVDFADLWLAEKALYEHSAAARVMPALA